MSPPTRAALAILAALAAAPARAEAGPVDDVLSALAWRAPAGCPDAAEVAIRVATHLGTSESLATETMTITADVTGEAGRWHLVMQLQLDDTGGERVLDAPTCSELADSAALIIALAIDPTLGGGGAAVVAPAPPVVASAVDHEEPPVVRMRGGIPADRPEPEPVAPPPKPLQLLVSAFAAADLGTLPGIGAGVGGAIDVAHGPWSVGITGGYWFTQRAELAMTTPEGPRTGGDVYVVAAGARTCRLLGAGFAGCGGVELEWMHGQPYGSEDLRPNWATAFLVMIDGVYRVGIGPRLTLRIDVQFAAAPLRAAFYERLIDGEQGDRIHQTGLAIGRSIASLEVAIP